MTKFGYHHGVVDQAYTNVMESICTMIGHAKLFYSSQGSLELSMSRQRSPLAVQGIEEIQKSSLASGLQPDNMENIHRPMTALATWNSGQASPSRDFKSLGSAGFPTEQSRVSSSLSSLVARSEASEAQPIRRSLKVGHGTNPKETQQEISNIVGSQNADRNMLHTGQSAGQKIKSSNWLSNINHQDMHNFIGPRRYQETGVWLSTTPEFQYWRDTSQSSLFLQHGGRRFFLQILSVSNC